MAYVPDGRCSYCGDAVKCYVGKAIDPPSRVGTPTPPPPSQREGGAVSGRTVMPPPPPAQQCTEGGGYVDPPLSALERALPAAPKRTFPSVELVAGLRRTMESSRQRLRSEEGSVGPVATKARMLAPSVMLTAARDRVEQCPESPSHERWEDVRSRTRYDPVHCGRCHGLSPLGSPECGFCCYRFLSARSPTYSSYTAPCLQWS